MHFNLFRRGLLFSSAAVLAGTLTVAGCHANHADEKDAVTNSLKTNSLGEVSVSQDREKGVMTLKGNVATDDQKQQAGTLAQQAAPDYQIANEIGVRPPNADQAGSVASNVDNGIEDNFKAAIKAHKALDDQSIRGSAKNGTLEIKGSVKTAQQKEEVEKLAKKIPNVQQVVNELEVKPNKHSSAAGE
ncbi:BON domain-containing protein [Occallatibacter riparius]|uniref:BON domain-containing protein n=1 Tax=Occallatibacter riparius TaxID=1002689 RepID=A0A9J7BH46_9BACT|nr:BON domain-containing protein [Occallatibacter riparius]UWZ82104.1 BON domain-containing protein [Occallatibacter riparius]